MLNISFQIISYGRYSKAFVNYIKNSKIDKDTVAYLSVVKLNWILKSEKLIKLIDESLETCQSASIRYLLLSAKLSATRATKDYEQNEKTYLKILKGLKKTPEFARNIVAKPVLSNNIFRHDKQLKKFRSWSKIHNQDEVDIAMKISDRARFYLQNKKPEQAIKIFPCVFKQAMKYPHPTYALLGLNNTAWHGRKININKAFEYSEKAAYYSGYFFDSSYEFFNFLDTVLVVSKMAGKYNTFSETAKLIRFYYEQLLTLDSAFKEKYSSAFVLAKKYCYCNAEKSIKQNEVKNTKGLREALLKHIGKINQFARENGLSPTSLYRILKGERETIRIETLKKIISAFGIVESFKNHKVINSILNLLKEETLFEENRKRIVNFSRESLQKMLLKGVMILPAELYRSVYADELKAFANENPEDSDIFSMSQQETDVFYTFISEDADRIRFFNHCVAFELSKPEQLYPFYQAHLVLVNMLFEEIGESGIAHLLNLYSSAHTVEAIERLNIYFRQYVRYSTTDWRFDVEEVLSERSSDTCYEKITEFCQQLNISELYGYLCTWFFENDKREKLLEVLL